MLVRLAIGFLLPFALERSTDPSDALVVEVLDVSERWMGWRVLVSEMRLVISFLMAAMNCALSGARRASVVSISSVSPV